MHHFGCRRLDACWVVSLLLVVEIEGENDHCFMEIMICNWFGIAIENHGDLFHYLGFIA